MQEWLGIAVGGTLGTILRHAAGKASAAVMGDGFPVGTLVVNLIGCLLIGFGWTAAERNGWLGSPGELTFRVGLLGGLTTFSSFGLEVVRLWQQGRVAEAGGVLLGNLVFGIAAVCLGMQLASALGAKSDS